MKLRMRDGISLLAAMILILLASNSAAPADVGAGEGSPGIIVLAQGAAQHGTEPAELEPRYRPAEPEARGWYNTDYYFAFSRAVSKSTMFPAAKLPLYVLSVPVDIALLPFAAIGGLFG